MLVAGRVELIDRVEVLAAGAVLFYDGGVLADELDALVRLPEGAVVLGVAASVPFKVLEASGSLVSLNREPTSIGVPVMFIT